MTTLLSSLTHHWKLDESSGNSSDSVGSLTLFESGSIGTGAGKINTGRDFSGGNGLFNTNTNNNTRSISFWFKADTLSGTGGTFIPYGPLLTSQGTNTQFVVDIYTTKIRFVIKKPAESDVVLEYIQSFTTGTWYFVVVTLDTTGKVMQLSVDGSALASTQTTFLFTYDENPNTSLILGAALGFYGTSSGFDGIIDEVSYWTNRILTDSDVAELYNVGGGLPLGLYGSPVNGTIRAASTLSGTLGVHDGTPDLAGTINATSNLSAGLSIFHPSVSLDTSYTKYLTSDISTEINWDLLDPDNGTTQEEVGDIQPEYELDTDVVDQAWYDAISIQPTSSYNLDLTAMPLSIFGMSVTRPFSSVNYFGIENTNPSSYLRTGSSGVSNSITNFGIISEIGYSGLSELVSMHGFSIDATHKNLTIRNPTNLKTTCKILILGISG